MKHRIPHNPEIERSVVGACLWHDEARDIALTQLEPGDFADPVCRRVFQAMTEAHELGDAPDLVLIADRTGLHPGELVKLHEGGGIMSVEGRVRRIREYRALRDGLVSVTKALAAARAADNPVDALAALRAAADALPARPGTRPDFVSAAEGAADLAAWLDAPAADGAPVSTGLRYLDAKLGGGMRPGELVVLGARPACGKSALAINTVAVHAATQGRVLVYSFEMQARELLQRMAAAKSGVHLSDVRARTLGTFPRDQLTRGLAALSDLDLHISDDRKGGLRHVLASARRKAAGARLSLVVVDYVQICRSLDPKAPREQQVTEVARSLKMLAGELDCPVLALSQLNRASLDRNRPAMSDLRESGALEQDADVVVLLHPDAPDATGVTAIVAKQRGGETGDVRLVFDRPLTQYRDPLPGDFTAAPPAPRRDTPPRKDYRQPRRFADVE